MFEHMHLLSEPSYGRGHTYIVLPGSSLQHGGEETRGKGEPREPEEDWRVGGCGPLGDLLHTQDEVPGPGPQGFLGGIGLGEREGGRGSTDIHVQYILQFFTPLKFGEISLRLKLL